MLTVIENLFLGLNLGEYHSGYRAYSRKALETMPFDLNSDDFVFDQEILVQAAVMRLRIGDIPVPAKYFADASSINFLRSAKYGLETLAALCRYVLHKTHLKRCDAFISNCENLKDKY